ncbi:Type I restriction-modification system, restriction subunit R (plasmid) [Pediococcus damnosus]|uniref:Type I restriction-modification system, restriction subunit R n=1 Tax=Pediococcus damnosus TaxID=51663 RepID=A0AAC9B504_9LACO|nr:Type I restriction-modification system, restriction subunit R [Pediococcus damnosus]
MLLSTITRPHIYLITVQGLDKAIKSGLASNKRMVILMDEAHRSASGDAVSRIKQALPKPLGLGLQGRLIFIAMKSMT